MLRAVVVMTVVSVSCLIAAVATHLSFLAWLGIGLSAVAVILLAVDTRRGRGSASAATQQGHGPERAHTAGDDVFGEHDVERDMTREERIISPDMRGHQVPASEVDEDLRRS